MNDDGDFVVAWEGEGTGDADGIFVQQFSSDTDGDGLCDDQDILITSHFDGSILNCSAPGISRPIVRWSRGNYDRFRAMISGNQNFPKRMRITSGSTLIKKNRWKPGRKLWRRACNNEMGSLWIRVFGIDKHLGNKHPNRRTLSQRLEYNVF